MTLEREREHAIAGLLQHCIVHEVGTDKFEASGPDWHGDRVFGGIVLSQAINAALRTVETSRPVHSMHGYFLRPEQPAVPVEIEVERVRDGRTFSTRAVSMRQAGKELFRATCSFHGGDDGDEYQLPMASDVPRPDEIEPEPEDDEEGAGSFEVRDVGPTPIRPDGTYGSTKRAWVRAPRLPDDPAVHVTLAAQLSDMTWSSFRPLSLGEWGHTADASLDHAVWFHRPFRVDEWIYQDFHALINADGRATVRGAFYTEDGRLVATTVQEGLVRLRRKR
jgi:acyl-CoA thioesterase II